MNGNDDKNDSVSIVSCSTRISDTTQDMDIPDLHRTTENMKIEKAIYRSLETHEVTKLRRISGCNDMSPLVPVQSANYTQRSSPVEDTASEMSELLIPVISNQSCTTIINKSVLEIQESQQIEESQSLLPQVAADSSTSYKHTVPSNNIKKGGWMSKTTDKMKANVGNSKNPSCDSIITSQTNNDISLSQPVISSQKDEETFSQQMDYTYGYGDEGFSCSQPVMFAHNEDVMTFSQVDKVFRNSGEVDSSQTVEILAEPKEKDPVERIISRLDRLVASLDNVSKRQKMVVEATILQCITSLQDNLNNKLKKQHASKDNAGIFRRLLQTSQTGLLKLTEQHRQEKIHLSQSASQSTPHITQKLNQSALTDLKKRQKKVFSLLKRQKYLVDLFKARKRLDVAIDNTAVLKSDHILSKTIETRQDPESGSTHPYDNNQRKIQPRKTCPRTTVDRRPVEKETSDSNIEDNRDGKRDSEIVKASVEKLSRQVQYMRRSGKDSKLRKDDVNDQFKDNEEKDVVVKEYKDVKKENEVPGALTENIDTVFEEPEDCQSSQDLTTIPDTQDIIITQGSAIENSSDNVNSIIATVSDNEKPECSADSGNTLLKIGVKSKVNDVSRNDVLKPTTIVYLDTTLDRPSFKRDIASNVKTDENVKKSKLVDRSEAVQQNELKTSEVLWLNMLKEDSNDKAEPDLSKSRTLIRQNDERKVTSRRLEEEHVFSSKKDIQNRVIERSNFQFIKPSLTKKPDMFEAGNKLGNSIEEKKFVNASFEKANKNKEQTVQSARGEVDESNVKTGVVVGLTSPPNITLPGETWHNISPTATSMSSDVFMVKMKDINKRMKRRVELSQNIEADRTLPGKHLDQLGSEVNEINVRKYESFDKQTRVSIPEKDTISETIDAVIKQSRDISTRNDTSKQGLKSNSNNGGYITSCESAVTGTSHQDRVISPMMNVVEAGTSKKPLFSGLPTLKELVQSGQLTPGKLVLSCFVKGKTHRASLTSIGKIRTMEGQVFVTASQWVSTLTHQVSVKKRKAFEMVLYKGRSLLSICINSCPNFLLHMQSSNTTPVNNNNVPGKMTKILTEQGTQVEDSDILDMYPKRSACEERLNTLLSNCVVRLLTDQDFVSCHDLPENFWTEDFSKVRLNKDIWDTVESW